jgi:hypothetical protein
MQKAMRKIYCAKCNLYIGSGEKQTTIDGQPAHAECPKDERFQNLGKVVIFKRQKDDTYKLI